MFSNRTYSALFLTLSSTLALACNGAVESSDLEEPSAALTAADDEQCIGDSQSAVVLSWQGAADDGTVLQARATSLDLVARNTTDAPLEITLTLTGDDGGSGDERAALGTILLAAHAQQTITVDARRLGFALRGLRYSGRLHVTAQVAHTDGRLDEPSISSPVFFHPASSSTGETRLVFYGKKALQASFRSGDYLGTARELAADSDREGLLRVMDVGNGNASPDRRRLAEARLALESERDGAVKRTRALPPEHLAAPVAAGAQAYRTCMLFRSQTIDSGIPIANGPNAGGVEDYRTEWNAGDDMPAYGVRVKLSRGSWEQTFDTEPDTGCFDWAHADAGPFLITVYGYVTNSMGTFARIHNAPDSFAEYPGTTYRLTYYYTPVAGATNYIAAGSYDSEWTAMGTLSFALLRLNIGAGNKAFHVAMDNAEDGWSSAHWGQSNAHITEGRHYLKIDNFDSASSKLHTQRKFVVSHELGHAFAALYYGSHADAQDGSEPSVNDDHDVGPSACSMGDSYSIESKEWNSLGFREGFAHFMAAMIWNNQDVEGSFHLLGTHHDLERYGDGIGASSGGRLENVCCAGSGCATSRAGAGTNEDWMLFFWDWYTNVDAACPTRPTRTDMLRLYRDTRLLGGLTKNNYFSQMRSAARDMNVVQCLKEGRFDEYAAWNGIDN